MFPGRSQLFHRLNPFFSCRRNSDRSRRSNYGTAPSFHLLEQGQPGANGGIGNGNNNHPATPSTPAQIFCLHGRSNNVEGEWLGGLLGVKGRQGDCDKLRGTFVSLSIRADCLAAICSHS